MAKNERLGDTSLDWIMDTSSLKNAKPKSKKQAVAKTSRSKQKATVGGTKVSIRVPSDTKPKSKPHIKRKPKPGIPSASSSIASSASLSVSATQLESSIPATKTISPEKEPEKVVKVNLKADSKKAATPKDPVVTMKPKKEPVSAKVAKGAEPIGPKGWHFRNEYVDKDGNVYHRGVLQESKKAAPKKVIKKSVTPKAPVATMKPKKEPVSAKVAKGAEPIGPKGWHFRNEFIDKDGNVYHRGVLQTDEKAETKTTTKPLSVPKAKPKTKSATQEKVSGRKTPGTQRPSISVLRGQAATAEAKAEKIMDSAKSKTTGLFASVKESSGKIGSAAINAIKYENMKKKAGNAVNIVIHPVNTVSKIDEKITKSWNDGVLYSVRKGSSGMTGFVKKGGSKIAGAVNYEVVKKQVGNTVHYVVHPIETASNIDRKITKTMKKGVVNVNEMAGYSNVVGTIQNADKQLTKSVKQIVQSFTQ